MAWRNIRGVFMSECKHDFVGSYAACHSECRKCSQRECDVLRERLGGLWPGLRGEIARLRTALEFYGKPENYMDDEKKIVPVLWDGGEIARRATKGPDA